MNSQNTETRLQEIHEQLLDLIREEQLSTDSAQRDTITSQIDALIDEANALRHTSQTTP